MKSIIIRTALLVLIAGSAIVQSQTVGQTVTSAVNNATSTATNAVGNGVSNAT